MLLGWIPAGPAPQPHSTPWGRQAALEILHSLLLVLILHSLLVVLASLVLAVVTVVTVVTVVSWTRV